MHQSAINEVLNQPLSQELLARDLTRLAFIGLDGTPRSIPIGFVWNGLEIVMYCAAGGRDQDAAQSARGANDRRTAPGTLPARLLLLTHRATRAPARKHTSRGKAAQTGPAPIPAHRRPTHDSKLPVRPSPGSQRGRQPHPRRQPPRRRRRRHDASGTKLLAALDREHQALVSTTRAALGGDRFQTEHRRGTTLLSAEAFALALEEAPARRRVEGR